MRAGGEIDIQLDFVALAFDVNDGAAGGEAGVLQFGGNLVEIRIAADAIDDGPKTGVERQGMMGGIEGEIGRFGGSFNRDFVETAPKIAHRREHAADSVDGVEIGMIEGEMAGDKGIAGTVGVPGAELAGGRDFTARNGVGEPSCVAPGRVAADVVEFDVFELELLRIFGGIGIGDDQARIVTDNLVDQDRNAGTDFRGRGGCGRAAGCGMAICICFTSTVLTCMGLKKRPRSPARKENRATLINGLADAESTG
jgi:hypothetical protein